MTYFSGKDDGSDVALSTIAKLASKMVTQMTDGIDSVIKNGSKEQGLIVSLRILRGLMPIYRDYVILSIGKKKIASLKSKFLTWYGAAEKSIPKKYRAELLKEAEREFLAWEKLLKVPPADRGF